MTRISCFFSFFFLFRFYYHKIVDEAMTRQFLINDSALKTYSNYLKQRKCGLVKFLSYQILEILFRLGVAGYGTFQIVDSVLSILPVFHFLHFIFCWLDDDDILYFRLIISYTTISIISSTAF